MSRISFHSGGFSPWVVSARCLNCFMTSQHYHPGDTSSVPGAPGVLARMQGEVRELAHTLWAARQPGELMETVAEIEALKTTLDALELDVVRELEATDAVKPRRLGLHPGLRHLGRRRTQGHRPSSGATGEGDRGTALRADR